jgi:hypothetical protein
MGAFSSAHPAMDRARSRESAEVIHAQRKTPARFKPAGAKRKL